MAIFIPGSKCAITGRPIEMARDATMFPSFISNKNDPLYIFNDAIVCTVEFHKHPLSRKALARYNEYIEKNSPERRICYICNKPILFADEYLGLGHLTDESSNPLHQFNYAHFHRSCLIKWTGLPKLIHDIEIMDQSGEWGGDSLKFLLKDIRNLNSI